MERRGLGREVLGLNPASACTPGSHSSGSLTIPRCKIGTRPWPGKSELTPRNHYTQVTERAGDGVSTLVLKPGG